MEGRINIYSPRLAKAMLSAKSVVTSSWRRSSPFTRNRSTGRRETLGLQ